MIGLAFLATATTGCKETWDENPVIDGVNKAYTNFLNVPMLQDTYIDLTEAGGSANAALHMTCSQPDWGYAAVGTYAVQVALTESFADYKELPSTFTDCAQINPVSDEVAEALCVLHGWIGASQMSQAYEPVYMRLRAFIPQEAELTEITSNVVAFNKVKVTYYAASVPDLPMDPPAFIRGSMNNWGNDLIGTPEFDATYQFLTTDKRGVYEVKDITLPAGEFKVADKGWGDINLGSASPASPGKKIKLEAGGANIKLEEDFTGRVLLNRKGGAGAYTWTLLLEKAGTFTPGQYPDF